MGSLLLCAFAYEGYLNFLGRKLSILGRILNASYLGNLKPNS